MRRCEVCKITTMTEKDHTVCHSCTYALDDARQNPSDRRYPQTGIVISGFSDQEVKSKKLALSIIKSKVTGGQRMSKAVFDKMCECVGIEFCYECGTSESRVAQLVAALGLSPSLKSNYDRSKFPDGRSRPFGGSDHAPIPTPQLVN